MTYFTHAIVKQLRRFILPGLFLLFSFLCAPAYAEQRIALVIGNNSYPDSPLKNPVNDANAVSKRLTELGFEVFTAADADLAAMQASFLNFVEQIEDGATTLVFYAGHGIQANGRNYLVPIDASLDTERSLRFEAMDVGDILEELEYSGSRVNLLVLDACRNNPFSRRFRGAGRGLAAIDAAAGTMIAYATAPGSVASDGFGDHGLYTERFLNALQKPGLKVEEVFKQVRVEVADLSDNQQIPWESSSLTGEFVFLPRADNVAASTSDGSTNISAQTELLYWQSIAELNDATLYEDYLQRFPGGTFASVAQARIRSLSTANNQAPQQELGQDIAAISSERSNTAERNACDDLSGEWTARIEGRACTSHIWLKQESVGSYTFSERLCGIAGVSSSKGSLDVSGPQQDINSEWVAPPCSGTITGQFSQDCKTASGQVHIEGGMPIVCRRSSLDFSWNRVEPHIE